jgi:hypothetical protein
MRRLHLYAGLFLAPWMLMYGVTAMLFNHPTAFPDQEGAAFGASDVQGTTLQNLRPADDVAASVVSELNRRAGSERYRLVRPDKAQYRGEFASAIWRCDGKAYTVFVDVRDGTGFAQLRDEPKEKAPFAEKAGVAAGTGVPDQVNDGLPAVLGRAGLPPGEVTVTFVPDVGFQIADADGREWKAVYSPLHGSLSGSPADPAETASTRRFLTRLHVSRGYTASPGARWFWALSVDAVGLTTIFWVVSGLVMWWQVKAVRWSGLIVIMLSAGAAAWLAIGLHAAFYP